MKIKARKGPRRSARQAILDAAAAVLAEAPGATMALVAEAAAVGRATLYRHFPSRKELVRQLSLEAIRLTDEAVAPVIERYTNAETALRETVAALVPLGDRYHFLAGELAVAAEPEVVRETDRQRTELTELVEQAKREGLFAHEVPTAWIVAALDALIWAAWSSLHRGELAARDAASLVLQTLLDGMGAKA